MGMETVTSQRTEALQRAAEQWKRQLVDVSGRNRLLNYRDLTVGTLDLTPERALGMDLRVLESLLAGRTVQMKGLFPDEEALADARGQVLQFVEDDRGLLDALLEGVGGEVHFLLGNGDEADKVDEVGDGAFEPAGLREAAAVFVEDAVGEAGIGDGLG